MNYFFSKKTNKTKIKFLLPIIIAVGFLLFLYSMIGNNKYNNIKRYFSIEQKNTIKKYIFPYTHISELQKQIDDLSYVNKELKYKETLKDIEIYKNSKLSNGMFLERYLLRGFYYGIKFGNPGSGYFDFYDNNIFILSSRGILGYSKNINDGKPIKQIKNNINEFIGLKQFKKGNWYSLKDILIYKDKIFISYTEELKENCWNTSLLYGKIDYENIEFKKLFSAKEEDCIHRWRNKDKTFHANQSGGRIVPFDDNHVMFTIGDWRQNYLPQNKESVNGKILKINIENGGYELISMGHRNPQGLYYDKENNFILETEHGPIGGDEINLIEVKKINKEKTLNYGWPIASYGEHQPGTPKEQKEKYKKYPLYKSHKKHGFIEPLKSFQPSIGISEIVKISQNKYAASSLKNKSLYFFDLNNEKKITNLEKVEVFERVRDLKVHDNKLYLFLELTASLGIINLKTN